MMLRFWAFASVCVFGMSSHVSAQMLTGFSDPSASPRAVPHISQNAKPVSPQPSSVEVFSLDEPGRVIYRVADTRSPETVFFPESYEPIVTRSFASPLAPAVPVVPASTAEKDQPVDLQADSLSYDETGQVVSAQGGVVLEQAGRTLTADRVEYNLSDDEARAAGNVVLTELTGDVYNARTANLSNNFNDGDVEGLVGKLADGSRFTAERGVRTGGTKLSLDDASYTACSVCDSGSVPWQIKAKKVTHHKDEQRVSYENAWFEFAGVPVFYTPYLSHSDGTIERKSGLLAPSAGFQSDLGFFVQSDYYLDIAPDKDATLGLRVMTEEAPLALGEYRQRWRDASLNIGAGITYSGRSDSEAGEIVQQDEEVRGHVFAEALWDVNEKWRSGVRVNWASDDQYLRQYDLDEEDVLENEIFAERFSGRNYAVGRLLTFQDIRVGENRQEDQPEVLPEVVASFIGDPNSVPIVGGRWQAEGSFLGLRREGSDQDLSRASLDLGWQRRLVSDIGLVTSFEARARGDLYHVRDRSDVSAGQDRNSTEARFYPSAHAQASYPLAKSFASSQLVIEPVVALTASTRNDDLDDIPNEDSQDVQVDAANLFETNRFPGFDRVEDRSRVTYGLRTGLYGHEKGQISTFLGQSYRLEDEDNPFPIGSGLEDQSSDIVGQISGEYDGKHSVNYNFQLENDSLASQRHEVYWDTNFHPVQFSGSYLYASALDGTDIGEDREQLRTALSYQITPEWAVRGAATHDFGDEDPGLRQARTGIDYTGQCWSFSLTGQRNFTTDFSGDSDTEIFMRIGLKNLGEFETAGF